MFYCSAGVPSVTAAVPPWPVPKPRLMRCHRGEALRRHQLGPTVRYSMRCVGDERAFEWLINQHTPAMLRLARLYTPTSASRGGRPRDLARHRHGLRWRGAFVVHRCTGSGGAWWRREPGSPQSTRPVRGYATPATRGRVEASPRGGPHPIAWCISLVRGALRAPVRWSRHTPVPRARNATGPAPAEVGDDDVAWAQTTPRW